MASARIPGGTVEDTPEGSGLLQIIMPRNRGGQASPPVSPQSHHTVTLSSPSQQSPEFSCPPKPGTAPPPTRYP